MILRTLSLIFGVVTLVAGASALHGVFLSVLSSDAAELSARVAVESPRSADGLLLAWTPLAEEALQSSVLAANNSHSARDTKRAVSWLREKSRHSKVIEEQVQYLCQAMGLYGGALQVEPRDSALLLGWGSLRQLLASAKCSQTLSNGSFSKVVDAAVEWNPYDRSVVFGGGLVQLWAGNRNRALELFNRVLTYSPQLSSGEESIVLSELRSASDFRTVVPAKLPQVVRWSRLVNERRPAEFELWHLEIGQIQLSAMADAQNRVKMGELPPEIYFRNLRVLLGVAAEDSVRRAIDKELAVASAVSGDAEAVDFFTGRAVMSKLVIVPSAAPADTRAIAPFVRWGGSETTYLDDFSQSIGFFLSGQQGVSLIVLRSLLGKSSIEPAAVRVLSSDDNEHWDEMPLQRVRALSVEGESLIALSVSTDAHQYWKVHYSSSQRERSFGAPLPLLITAYGNSSRRQ